MKPCHRYLLALAFACTLVVGCASRPSSTDPGNATLMVQIVAEPNPLLPPKSDGVDSYGGPGNAPRQLTPVDYAHLDGIVVWLEPAVKLPASNISPLKLSFTNPDRDTETGVRGVQVGATVTIANDSSAPQSFFSVSKGNEFDFGKVPPGGKATFQIQAPGQIDVFCDSMEDPFTTILGVQTPYVATAMASKPATFTNIKPGSYQLRCWTIRLPGSAAPITLGSGQSAKVQLRVGVTQLRHISSAVTKGK